MKYVIATLALISFQLTFGQTKEYLSSDRPGQSFGPLTVGERILQIQNGINYSQFDNPGFDGNTIQDFLSIRYGIWENIEVRSDFGFQQDEIDAGIQDIKNSGLSHWSFGIKYDILEDHPTGPAIGVIYLIDFKWLGDDYTPARTTQHVILVVSHNWTDRFNTTTNLGLNADDISSYNNYTLNFGYSISNDLFCFVENYGEFGSPIPGHFDNRWNGGFGYYVNHDLQLDCSAGFGKNGEVSDWFADVGLTWRIWLK